MDYMGWKEKIEMLLKERFKESEPNWRWLARAIGESESTVEKWKAPTRIKPPPADVGLRIARELGVSCEWLWDDSVSERPPSTPQLVPLSGSPPAAILEMMGQALLAASRQAAPPVSGSQDPGSDETFQPPG